MKENERIEDLEFKHSKFRLVLLFLVILVIILRILDIVLYPDAEIIPTDIIFVVAILQLFGFWYDSVNEKNRILWLQKKKETLDEMKNKFTIMTSHELMTPITVIKTYIGMMTNKLLGDLTEKQQEALDVMNKYFARLEMIHDNLTKLYSGNPPSFEENLKPYSAEKLIKTTADDIMPFIKRRNQNLSVEIDHKIPEVVMDPNGIRQVMVNLLLNSIRFTPDNGNIIIRAKDNKSNVRVEVEDNGIGIPKDKLTHIFESFYEVQDTAEAHSSGSIGFKSGGIGLGLTITKNIIDFHKGNIWAESEEGKFSRFIFTLPKER